MSTQGNGGFYSKFQERLRKMRMFRSKKKQENEKYIQDKVQEIRKEVNKGKNGYVLINKSNKVVNNSLSEVLVDIKDTVKDRNYVKNKAGVSENYIDEQKKEESFLNLDAKNDSKVVINDELESKRLYIKENKPEINRNKKSIDLDEFKSNISDEDKKEKLSVLGADIIGKIKNSFEYKLDELEVLSSELYLLSQQQKDEVELEKIEEIKEKINELIGKINGIIEQYNLYKKNYYIDNVVDIDDAILVDDIINYRDLLDSLDEKKNFVKQYKNLEEFKFLYNNLVSIKLETENIKNANEEKIEEYKIRDKKYDDIKTEMVSVLDIDKKCLLEIEKQNKYFNDLMKKISDIKSEEYITLHMKGIGQLVSQSLRYMGLLILSPLTGIIPGIAMHTMATGRMVGNIYNQLHLEKKRHIYYQAINYESELNQHLSDINYTEKLIYNTLKDVENIKADFMMIYNSSIPGYDDTLKNLDKIKKMLMHSQNRVSIVKKNLYKGKKLNDDKLSLVKKLNDEQNL